LTRIGYPTRGFLGVLFLVKISDCDICAFTGERNGNRPSDTTVSAGD